LKTLNQNQEQIQSTEQI